jgi:hypothetical protein
VKRIGKAGERVILTGLMRSNNVHYDFAGKKYRLDHDYCEQELQVTIDPNVTKSKGMISYRFKID